MAEKIGTLNYMSPEVLLEKSKEIDYSKSDVNVDD